MSRRCPTCGQESPLILAGEELAATMRRDGGRDCYRGQDGNYYLSRSGGQVQHSAIIDAISKGLIVPKWPDTSHEYWKVAP